MIFNRFEKIAEILVISAISFNVYGAQAIAVIRVVLIEQSCQRFDLSSRIRYRTSLTL